jgi:demethylmenaquinone methyltransferase / 2-methoxy-6-polyprenyl-1,4-benzoquinol methylase
VTVTPYHDKDSGKKEQVEKMFNNIASRYDMMNTVLSAGIHKRWRKKAVRLLLEKKPKVILDLATGTGDFAIAAMQLHPEKIIGADISEGMMEVGKEKVKKLGLQHTITFQKGDSENLPFPDNSFDAITVGFGVRNFEDLLKGLQNMNRVLKPGGMAVIVEFSKVKKFPFRQLFGFYFRYITPLLGRLFTRDKAAYTYLPESVSVFPAGRDFENIMQQAGFQETRTRLLSFGIASIYTGIK